MWPKLWPVILLTVMLHPLLAQPAQSCGAGDISALSIDQVMISDVDHGFYTGQRKYAVRCGLWLAEALYDRKSGNIALMIEGGASDPAPSVPAPVVASLTRLPLRRLFDGEEPLATHSLTIRNYSELAQRLMEQARQSPSWDIGHGRPRRGTPGNFVREIMNKDQLYPELAALAAEFGFKVRVSEVEKVELCSGRQTASARASRDGAGRVPCGALVTFQLYR
jgi:hypothetical protein